MTELARGQQCRWCTRPIDSRPGPGRPKRFCRPACRQAAYRARRLASGHGLADGEVIVREDVLEALGDAQYALTAALEDVELDLAEATGPQDVREALDHLVEACGELAALQVRPVADRR